MTLERITRKIRLGSSCQVVHGFARLLQAFLQWLWLHTESSQISWKGSRITRLIFNAETRAVFHTDQIKAVLVREPLTKIMRTDPYLAHLMMCNPLKHIIISVMVKCIQAIPYCIGSRTLQVVTRLFHWDSNGEAAHGGTEWTPAAGACRTLRCLRSCSQRIPMKTGWGRNIEY